MYTKDGSALNANKLCHKCVRTCRQSAAILLLDCPRYLARPFKVEPSDYTQLDLFDGGAEPDSLADR